MKHIDINFNQLVRVLCKLWCVETQQVSNWLGNCFLFRNLHVLRHTLLLSLLLMFLCQPYNLKPNLLRYYYSTPLINCTDFHSTWNVCTANESIIKGIPLPRSVLFISSMPDTVNEFWVCLTLHWLTKINYSMHWKP